MNLNKYEFVTIVSVCTAIILLIGYNIGLMAFKSSCEPVGVSQDKPEWLECPLK
jgi:hypothetical protein